MKRLFHLNDFYSSMMYEAPVAWQRFPNACRLVTTVAVRTNEFHDSDRLFSALIRIVRRDMTFNEASASHHISLNLIKEVYKNIFSAMSDMMMKLMNEKKNDIEVILDEMMDERGFHFDQVDEKDLITTTNEYGEEYAIIDPLIGRSKINRIEPLGPPQPLPIPPERLIQDWAMKGKEMEEKPIKSLLVRPVGLLNAASKSRNTKWNGGGLDYITRKMMGIHASWGWKFDDNGENNSDIISILFRPQIEKN
ncbi:hypothetical protein PENTCL1PPCAC_23620, partial [Pristionchus entomophagus]